MRMRRLERHKVLALPDALLTLAASLQDATTADDVLDRLTSGLAERNVACALLVHLPDESGLQLERATLPLAPDVWGRALRLPAIAAALTQGRPLTYSRTGEAFTESLVDGPQRLLLTSRVPGTVIASPLRGASNLGAVLCLVSPELHERDRTAAWALALQLGAALRETASSGAAAPTNGRSAQPHAEELSLFDELTRRLSHSLSDEEIVRTTLEVLAPALGFQLAAAVSCRDGEDAVTVYAAREVPAELASNTAAGALTAFLRLTGEKHRSCQRLPFQTTTLAIESPPDTLAGFERSSGSVLDAPLVIEGEVTGLLRARSVDPNGFDSSKKRTFYTVANQVSLALERAIVQRQTERAHLASLAESLSDGIVLVDADLRVTSLNQAAHDHLSSLADVRLAEGATLTDTTLAKLAEQALTSGEPTKLQDLPTSAVSPERRYLVAMAAPLAGSREGSAAVVILRDVTEERLMQERLLQSEKMVSVGQLVSGVAHELNNPLTGIMGFAQLLLAREELDDRTRNDVQTIYTEADRAAKIVQNLLSFARRKRTEKESANLNVLLERVLELRSYDLRVKNIEVELDLDPNLPQTMVDTNQIQQVFFNIIINAEQAMMSEEGRGTLKVRSWRQQDAIRLSLQDDGPGIDDETLRRIFDPFFTTKQAGEGTGLGLTISYGIIDEHGGRIWAESRPGHGTAFIIELPIVQGSERPRAAPEEELSTATGGSILVVDDEESIQRLLGSILEMDGHKVDTARNGIEALERIGRGHYDVIITDIKMPDMDGRALYQRLLELDNDLAQRTVFITGDTVSPDTRDFLDQVRNPCLAKPFRIRQVRETISQILPNGS